ncbi:MAG: riboflavin synthase subunit alpha [Pseudomonadota bacterium]|jgi:riboflavin synthase
MFTGIVKGRGRVVQIRQQTALSTLQIELPHGSTDDLEIGASISIDGVCLTVTSIEQNSLVTFDVMAETLRLTTLGSLIVGSEVNIERSARDGAEIGGHPLSGHIDCVCVIERITKPENNLVLTFKVPEPFIRYIFSKGYVGLNGTSLTASNVNKNGSTFDVWFIPETIRVTTFGAKQVGDRINLEIERGAQVTVDTIRDYLDEKFGALLPKLRSLLGDNLLDD